MKGAQGRWLELTKEFELAVVRREVKIKFKIQYRNKTHFP